MANALCAIMAYIHQNGLLHNTLHPDHIAVKENDSPIIGRLPLFALGHPFGGAAYRSPEHIRDEPQIQRTDVYMLGMILYELLVGVHPFAAESEDMMVTLQIQGSPESPRLRWPEIPSELEYFLLKLLALSPSDRYPSALEVRDELARLTEITLQA